MKTISTLFLIFCTLLSCGGGGGGGDGGYVDPNPIDHGTLVPTPDTEPYQSGETITKQSYTWTIEIENTVYETTSTSQSGNIYFFDPTNQHGGTLNGVAAANSDVQIFGVIFEGAEGEDPVIALGMQGNFSTNPPSGARYYEGQYTSMSPEGVIQGTWQLEIYIDFDNIPNSYGYDTETGDTIQIHFVEMTNDAISGTISDGNHDYNLVSLSTFGDEHGTIAGGYANETGVGILIAID